MKNKNTIPLTFACVSSTLLLIALPATAKDALSGQTSAAVIESLGEPKSKKSEVGTPAISSWSYKNSTVYFENNRVIHIVKK